MSSDSKSMNFLLDLENVSVLKNHVLFENNEKEKPFFEKRANLNRLIKTIYENKTPFQCEKRANLNRHIRTIYENKTPFQCKACDDRFSEQVSLRAHITEVHEGKKLFKSKDNHKLLQCTTCGIRFTKKGSLNKHMAKIHNQLRTYTCKLCGSIFDENHKLKTHICFGRNKKPAQSGIKCSRCDDSFLDKIALRDHIIKEHTSSYSTNKRL